MKIKSIVIMLIFAGLIGLAFYSAQEEKEEPETVENTTDEDTGLKPGSKAHDFSLKTLDGKQIQLNDYRGKR